MNFYPFISQNLLNEALKFASNYTEITEVDKEIIFHAKKSLLFNNGTPWSKKNSHDSFGVTMDSFDGAETCELVGSYLLCQLPETIRTSVSLYRDDGLGIFRESPRRIDQIKKQICKTFNKNGLKITTQANKKVISFLEVTLDLTKESFEPYTKPNNTPLYVHHSSNHSPTIIRNIPLAINRRLNGISSTREAFERAAPEYQRALNKSGYAQQLQYQTGQTADDQPRTKPPARHRKITWYNPPDSQNVATNVGRKFLNIVKESFKEGHPLKKIFNKNTLKLGYSCMPNLASKITSHNKSALEKTTQSTEKLCNCRTQSKCPLNGKCLTTNVAYQATVESDGNTDTYIGLTADTFKTRYNNHTASFKTETKRNATDLSKHIWALQDRKST